MDEAELEFIAPSWSDIEDLLSTLARMIREDGFRPDIIVGLSKGGIIPAAILSDRLGVDLDFIGVRYYRSIKNTDEKPRILQHISTDLRGKRVLVLDDVTDTGHSLQTVKEYVRERGATDVMFCTLHYKPWSVFKPDHFVEETEAWVVYPWEVNETIDDLVEKLGRRGLTRSQIKEAMVEGGIPEDMIEGRL